ETVKTISLLRSNFLGSHHIPPKKDFSLLKKTIKEWLRWERKRKKRISTGVFRKSGRLSIEWLYNIGDI
ncbi:hypothetical protein, partial [Acidaminococcus massiliensis]